MWCHLAAVLDKQQLGNRSTSSDHHINIVISDTLFTVTCHVVKVTLLLKQLKYSPPYPCFLIVKTLGIDNLFHLVQCCRCSDASMVIPDEPPRAVGTVFRVQQCHAMKELAELGTLNKDARLLQLLHAKQHSLSSGDGCFTGSVCLTVFSFVVLQQRCLAGVWQFMVVLGFFPIAAVFCLVMFAAGTASLQCFQHNRHK